MKSIALLALLGTINASTITAPTVTIDETVIDSIGADFETWS